MAFQGNSLLFCNFPSPWAWLFGDAASLVHQAGHISGHIPDELLGHSVWQTATPKDHHHIVSSIPPIAHPLSTGIAIPAGEVVHPDSPNSSRALEALLNEGSSLILCLFKLTDNHSRRHQRAGNFTAI